MSTGEFGYAGKILMVNLSTARMTEEATASYADRFLGGKGIAAKIYWDEVPPDVGPLDPDNRLIFITGPFAGITGVAGSRWLICGKTPAFYPSRFNSCSLGGRWGAQLKLTGYDGIVVQGKSEKPAYLLIQGDTAELRDASALWGKDAVAVREILKGELGKSARVVTMGPAGENLVSMATVLADQDAAGSSFGAAG